MSKRSKRDSRKNSEKKNDGQQREYISDEVLSDAFASDLQVGDQSDPVPAGSVRPVGSIRSDRSGPRSGTLSRRRFLGGMGAAAVAAAVGCGDRSPSDAEDVDGGPDPDDDGGVDTDGGTDIVHDGGQNGGQDGGQDGGQNEGMLFASNFEGDVQFSAPYGCGSTSCWQDIVGTDPTTGFDWADLSVLNGSYQGHLITGESGTNTGNIGDYHHNEVMTTTGPHGNQTRAARFRTLLNTRGDNQNVFGYTADQSTPPERLYWRYWIRLEADLAEKMGPSGWISFWAWKTSGGDYRLTSQIWTDSSSNLFWNIQGDNEANNPNFEYERYFRLQNKTVPVPQGEWFKVEVFYDRNGRGRAWQAINGVVVFDHIPPEGQNLYGVNNGRIRGGTFLTVRAAVPRTREVWLDEFEVWDDFPPDAAPH